MKNLIKTPFASALAGGLVVAVLGLVAIATGSVDAGGDSTTTTTTVPAPARTALASDDAGKALTRQPDLHAGLPRRRLHRGPAAGAAAPFNPFGPSQGGTATGSGFVIDDDGHILTNAHVVEGADEVTVRVGGEDGQTFDAKVVGADPSTDVAVLEVDSGSDQLQPLDARLLGRGRGRRPVVAIGNPFGLDRTATAGIVSAVQRQINAPNGFTIENAIQTDAPINPGNSGGPLIDAEGQVIGINSQIESGRSASGNVGIGFAVPIDTAQEIAQQLIDDGRGRARVPRHQRRRPDAGDRRRAQPRREQRRAGPGVVPDSPADEAGIEAGDAQVTVAGQRIRAGGDVITAVDGAAGHGHGRRDRRGRREEARRLARAHPACAAATSAPSPSTLRKACPGGQLRVGAPPRDLRWQRAGSEPARCSFSRRRAPRAWSRARGASCSRSRRAARELAQVVGPARLRADPREPVAAERLAGDHRPGGRAVDVEVAGRQPRRRRPRSSSGRGRRAPPVSANGSESTIASASSMPGDRLDAEQRPEDLLAAAAGESAGRSVATVGALNQPPPGSSRGAVAIRPVAAARCAIARRRARAPRASISGGTSVAKLSAWPTISESVAPASRSSSVSATASWTSTRDAAEHFWPA